MSLEQAIVGIVGAVIVALIGLFSGVAAERAKWKRDRDKEIHASVSALEQARINDEAQRRKEIDEAARDLRDFLVRKVDELNGAIGNIEQLRAAEREKWNQMLGQLSTKNLELELQHRRDLARISELEDDAKFIDDEVMRLRSKVTMLESDLLVLDAKYDSEKQERNRLERFVRKLELELEQKGE